MWHSQTVVHEDGENDVRFCKCAPFSKQWLMEWDQPWFTISWGPREGFNWFSC